jgi:hypothetical protein
MLAHYSDEDKEVSASIADLVLDVFLVMPRL